MPTAMTLTIVAIRDNALSPHQILKEPDRHRPHPIVLDGVSIGILYVKPSKPITPKWLDFFEDSIDPKSLRLRSSSSAAVLLVRRNGKTFAVTFGHGRHMLDPEAIEAGFGLRTALNGIDADRIRSMDRRTLEAVSMYTREQASRESSLSMFDVNVQRDFLRSVTGSPLDSDLGTRVTGSDALTFTSHITIRTLLTKIDDWFQLSTKTAYKDNFGWVDNLADVRDSGKAGELDEVLVGQIRAQAWERIWLAPPEIVDWSDIGGFKFRTNKESQPSFSELELDGYFDDRHRSPDDKRLLHNLKADSVFVQSRLHDTYVHKWKVYRCVCAEVEQGGVTYVLNEGKWYRIATEFAASVRTFVDNMSRTSVPLPQCENETEGDYNERAAKASQLTLMDGRTVKAAPGRSQIEVCDLYDRGTRAFVHVKRYSGSSTLSHLFAQGEISAQNMVSNAEFRRNARAKFPKAGLEVDSFDPRRHEVAYAIIAKPGKGEVTLPFFSAVNLRRTAEWLKLMGFRSVTLTMIPNAQ